MNNVQNYLNVELYTGCEDIIHFALCCFVKIPLEATAESIGSVINRHGRKERCSLRPDVLSSECQISWNGPSEFSKEASDLIDEAIEDHFKNNKCGMRFFVTSKLKIVSSTISTYINRPSRIDLKNVLKYLYVYSISLKFSKFQSFNFLNDQICSYTYTKKR